MNVRILLVLLTSVGLSAAAQILFKLGMLRVRANSAGAEALEPLAALSNLTVVAGFVLYGCSALLWLHVLGRTELSVAYPFVSLGFIATMAAGWLLFGEAVTASRMLGTLLVCAGVILIAQSSK